MMREELVNVVECDELSIEGRVSEGIVNEGAAWVDNFDFVCELLQ
jgi:hypothetical protein